jgi:hypothetical protein
MGGTQEELNDNREVVVQSILLYDSKLFNNACVIFHFG